MHKETIDALAQVVVRNAVIAAAKDVESLTISELLGDELPGLDSDAHETIYNRALEYLDIVEVHVEIPFWRLDKDDPLNQILPL